MALLIQLPSSLTAKEGVKKVEALIHLFDPGFRYAIEVRNKSWFVPEVYKLLSDNNVCLAWSQLDNIQTPPIEKDGELVGAKIIVYDGEEDEYFRLITPEAYRALACWMKYREESGETITEVSWLMRDLWDVSKPYAKGPIVVLEPFKYCPWCSKKLVKPEL